jgi:hypothetical protein
VLLRDPDDLVAGDVRLAASEMVTNVIVHTAGGGELRAWTRASVFPCGSRWKTAIRHRRYPSTGHVPSEAAGWRSWLQFPTIGGTNCTSTARSSGQSSTVTSGGNPTRSTGSWFRTLMVRRRRHTILTPFSVSPVARRSSRGSRRLHLRRDLLRRNGGGRGTVQAGDSAAPVSDAASLAPRIGWSWTRRGFPAIVIRATRARP